MAAATTCVSFAIAAFAVAVIAPAPPFVVGDGDGADTVLLVLFIWRVLSPVPVSCEALFGFLDNTADADGLVSSRL